MTYHWGRSAFACLRIVPHATVGAGNPLRTVAYNTALNPPRGVFVSLLLPQWRPPTSSGRDVSPACDTALLPERTIKLIFWLCLALVIYAYMGYAVWLWVLVRLRRRPVLQSPIAPHVTIIVAASVEEAKLPAKLESLRHLDCPRDHLQIIRTTHPSTYLDRQRIS